MGAAGAVTEGGYTVLFEVPSRRAAHSTVHADGLLGVRVDWQYQKLLAESVVKTLRGITGITNKIEVTPPVSPKEMKDQIKAALERSTQLDARRVRVEVEGNVVKLFGNVDSWAEKSEAERVAWSAPGCQKGRELSGCYCVSESSAFAEVAQRSALPSSSRDGRATSAKAGAFAYAVILRANCEIFSQDLPSDSNVLARPFSKRAGAKKMNPDPNSTPPETASERAARPADLQALQTELAAQKDRYLRLAADFDNFRKRTNQESERRAAVQKDAFIRELLSVIDNLERALGSDPSASTEQLREGVRMTLQQFHQLLSRHGIEPEETIDQPFDPRYHEAVLTRYEPSRPDGIILETFQRGYRRGSEVFRPAKVAVNDLTNVQPTSEGDPRK